MIDVGMIYDKLGPLNAAYVLAAPALVTFMAILVSSSLWTRSKQRGFGHMLACLGVFVGTVAFFAWTSMLLVLLETMIQSQLHQSETAYWKTLGGLLVVDLFISVMFVDKAITTDEPGGKRRYYYQDTAE